jgi:chromosomal replication initiator protein
MDDWNRFIKHCTEIYGKDNVEQWIKPLNIQNFDAQNIFLEAPTKHHKYWFKQHVEPLLKNLLVIPSSQKPYNIQFVTNTIESKSTNVISKTANDKIELGKDYSLLRNKKLSFETFYITAGNKLAHQTLKHIEQISTSSKTPIYIFGPSKSGKTHLMHSIANQISNQNKSSLLMYSGQSFAYQVIDAMRNHYLEELMYRLHRLDYLIIDKIEDIGNKPSVQEVFFHFFNHFKKENKTLLITANDIPANLKNVEQRIISRLEWGTLIDIQNKILIDEFDDVYSQMNIPIRAIEVLKQQTIEYSELLTNTKNLTRIWQTFQTKYHKEEDYSNERIRDDLSALNDICMDLDIEILLNIVAFHFGIRSKDITGTCRKKEYTYPRHVFIYLAKKILNLPIKRISMFINRNHSTVMSSLKKSDIQKKPDSLARDIAQIIRLIKTKNRKTHIKT